MKTSAQRAIEQLEAVLAEMQVPHIHNIVDVFQKAESAIGRAITQLKAQSVGEPDHSEDKFDMVCQPVTVDLEEAAQALMEKAWVLAGKPELKHDPKYKDQMTIYGMDAYALARAVLSTIPGVVITENKEEN